MTINIANPDITLATNEISEVEEGKGGIYLIYDEEGKLLYLGQSEDLKKRIRKKMRSVTGASKFSLAYVADPFHREIYETNMINDLKPRDNVKKVFYK
jgi:excinuclease UvrABC nuclease subunit